jgi:hypothetical protein
MAHIIPPPDAEEPCNHRWERLNDHQVFCVFCREVQTIPDQSQPNPIPHHHCWCGQHHIYHPWPPFIGDTYVPRPNTITYGPDTQFTLTDRKFSNG